LRDAVSSSDCCPSVCRLLDLGAISSGSDSAFSFLSAATAFACPETTEPDREYQVGTVEGNELKCVDGSSDDVDAGLPGKFELNDGSGQ